MFLLTSSNGFDRQLLQWTGPPKILTFSKKNICIKIRPRYVARHTAAKCGKAARQKLRHATSICGRCVGLAAACRSMLRGLKI